MSEIPEEYYRVAEARVLECRFDCPHWHIQMIVEVEGNDLPWPANLAYALSGRDGPIGLIVDATIRSMN